MDLDHNRFLILQGEVEQIALMKPIGQNENDTGMLEFLEDIIGKKKHALNKYDQFARNTSYFREVSDQILPQMCNFTKFLL